LLRTRRDDHVVEIADDCACEGDVVRDRLAQEVVALIALADDFVRASESCQKLIAAVVSGRIQNALTGYDVEFAVRGVDRAATEGNLSAT
jgi:hypothetical protein